MHKRGYYDGFGGAFLPEILTATFDQLEKTFEEAKADPTFWPEYCRVMSTYSCTAHAPDLRREPDRAISAARRSTSSAKT